jgi:hypothetical protein
MDKVLNVQHLSFPQRHFLAANEHFQRALQHVRHLLALVRVLWHNRAALQVNLRHGLPFSGHKFPGNHLGDFFERDGGDFEFHPELFEHRSRASELLETAGYTWFSDFSSIEPIHEEYGLEICGILNEGDVGPIAEALQRGFPHWHHQRICLQDHGREPGWTVSLCMFPARPCNLGWYDGD